MIARRAMPPSNTTNCERGAGMAEYALILTLIAAALVVGFGDLATAIDAALDRVVGSFP